MRSGWSVSFVPPAGGKPSTVRRAHQNGCMNWGADPGAESHGGERSDCWSLELWLSLKAGPSGRGNRSDSVRQADGGNAACNLQPVVPWSESGLGGLGIYLGVGVPAKRGPARWQASWLADAPRSRLSAHPWAQPAQTGASPVLCISEPSNTGESCCCGSPSCSEENSNASCCAVSPEPDMPLSRSAADVTLDLFRGLLVQACDLWQTFKEKQFRKLIWQLSQHPDSICSRQAALFASVQLRALRHAATPTACRWFLSLSHTATCPAIKLTGKLKSRAMISFALSRRFVAPTRPAFAPLTMDGAPACQP